MEAVWLDGQSMWPYPFFVTHKQSRSYLLTNLEIIGTGMRLSDICAAMGFQQE
jgi:hypothetical protein